MSILVMTIAVGLGSAACGETKKPAKQPAGEVSPLVGQWTMENGDQKTLLTIKAQGQSVQEQFQISTVDGEKTYTLMVKLGGTWRVEGNKWYSENMTVLEKHAQLSNLTDEQILSAMTNPAGFIEFEFSADKNTLTLLLDDSMGGNQELTRVV